MKNLASENLGARSLLTGDVLLDCLCMNEKRADAGILNELGISSEKFHLMTLHRPENTDLDRYERFCDIMSVASRLDKPVIWPVHPRTEPILRKYTDAGKPLGAVRTVPPFTYLRLLALLQNCDLVLTDSGGLPREAAWSGKRCVVLYGSDLWPDLIEQGWTKLAGADRSAIEKAVAQCVPADASAAREFFGAGMAAQKVVEAIRARFYDEDTGCVFSDKGGIGVVARGSTLAMDRK
jgi:UDP-GlcNAc3NAcA epimerase